MSAIQLAFTGVGYAALAFACWIALQSSAVPYNVRELLAGPGGVAAAAIVPIVFYATLVPPVLLARWMARPGPPRVALAILGAPVYAGALWIVVREIVPPESIGDVVGLPVLGWPGGLETAMRFVVLGIVVATTLTAGALAASVSAASEERYAKAVGVWSIPAIVYLALGFEVVVRRAGTDNLVELLRGEGGLVSFGAVVLAAISLAFAGSTLSRLLVRAPITPWGAAWRLLAGIVSASVWLFVGLNPRLEKYGQTFSAIQFLLSPDRDHYVSGGALLLRLAVALIAGTAVIAVAQYPAWTTRRGS